MGNHTDAVLGVGIAGWALGVSKLAGVVRPVIAGASDDDVEVVP
jgi:hypothetical protein